ncbi:MAG: type VI secretion system domain-containing protein, partial [Myxococcales bacterium]|nr:type VI secretion system domain-containing protein [Myxococcales bacterium]
APASAPAPAAPAPAPAPAAPAPAPVAARSISSANIESDEQADRVLEQIIEALGNLGAYHIRTDRKRSIGYQLAHLATSIAVVPDGDRMPSDPTPKIVQNLAQAIDLQDFDVVVEIAEQCSRDKMLSVNIQQMLFPWLEQIRAEQAAKVVSTQSRELADRMDGMLMLSEDARAWVKSGGAPRPAPRHEPPPAAAEAQAAPVGVDAELARAQQLIERAREITARSGLDEGCRELGQALRSAGTPSLRFHLRLAMAQLCVEEGAADLARPVLQDLRVELDAPVCQWTPSLLVDVCTTTLACNRQLERVAEDDETRSELERETADMMTLLARVAPDVAFRERLKT